MSHALKRLSAVPHCDNLLASKQNIYALLHQWHTKSLEPSNYNGRATEMGGVTAAPRKHHVRMYHGILRSSLLSVKSESILKQSGNQRGMSIITDLLRKKKKDYDEEEVIPEAKTLPLLDESPKGLTDEEIEAKRNISRLSVYHQRLVHGQHPYTEPKAWIHHTVRYKQRMFGRYGESSGVNPGILWPTRDELKDKIEYEKVCNPFTIHEMVEKKRALRQAEKEENERRIKEVEAKMAMVDKYKEDLAKRLAAKEREADVAKARREKLMEEVRRHFGYTVDSRDERFQELLAKKEKEQRKSLKEARKLQKQQKILQKIEGKSEKPSKTSRTAEKNEDKDDDDD